MSDEGLREVGRRHLRAMLGDCPPSTLLAVTIVVVGGDTVATVAVSPQVSEGGADVSLLSEFLALAIDAYIGTCPNVVALPKSGEDPS